MTWHYKLVKVTRAIRILFGGLQEPDEWLLFWLPKPLSPEEIAAKLSPHDFYYNWASTTHKGEVYTVRRLLDTVLQIHLRFYESRMVTGHIELIPEFYPSEHLTGVNLRSLSKEEKWNIWEKLK